MDVRNLSDGELKEQLVRNGVNPGPILPTTRFVYEKKLQQLLDQGPPVPQERQNGGGDMDQYSDSEEEDPHESQVPQRREFLMAAASNNASIFNHSKTPFREAAEASKTTVESDSSFSVTRMVEQADDSLQKADVTDQYISSQSPLGISATRRMPIKGAAGRPIQFKYDDILTHAKLAEQAKLEAGKGSARKRLPVYLQVALFAIIAFFALVFLTMENNSENPFHPYVEQGEVQLPH